MGESDDDIREGGSQSPTAGAGGTAARPAGEPTDAGKAPASLEAELERLRQEAAESHDRYLRERAESENVRKRLQREKVEALRFANEPLVRDLLPVVDNLERAVAHCPPSDTALRAGLELVLGSLLEVLERHNVKRIESEGTGFDPAFHEAIAQIQSAEHAPNAVTQQHQVGYLLNDRLLRPALVTVNANKPEPDAVESEPNSD